MKNRKYFLTCFTDEGVSGVLAALVMGNLQMRGGRLIDFNDEVDSLKGNGISLRMEREPNLL